MTGKTLNTDTAVAADAERDTEMTEPKITRERLIELLDGAYLKATERPQDASVYLEQAAAYTLALQALDMEPREGWVMVPKELTEKMILAMHHQIDWCRNDQSTAMPRHESQKAAIGGELVGTFCEDDLRDAWNAALSSLPEPSR